MWRPRAGNEGVALLFRRPGLEDLPGADITVGFPLAVLTGSKPASTTPVRSRRSPR
jgi:hypothetical protein